MKDFHPNFLALSKNEEDFLVNRLDAARKAISHAGEKGRSLEAEVTTLLRSFLPEEYGLTTGFVVYHKDKMAWKSRAPEGTNSKGSENGFRIQ